MTGGSVVPGHTLLPYGVCKFKNESTILIRKQSNVFICVFIYSDWSQQPTHLLSIMAKQHEKHVGQVGPVWNIEGT